ncbi:unnamed protein product [Adineta steineri]|uniref:F-box domain-containing protein n=1 Tax=Adineta steineri TaxID=433720 RepID=A0A815LWM0_9BILA|nr:unnamed protein product [Adineta steineri]CAF4133501.1 unnamed protein product [Adineta steineri]
MNDRTVRLLDLPDEILLIIMNKLGSMNVLYSLLNTNRRLDQMARSINNTKFIDFSIELSDGQFSSIDNIKLDRFCEKILPEIHHKIVGVTFELAYMERILLAHQYPNLTTIVIVTFSTDILLDYLTKESAIARLFKEQIKQITVKSEKKVFTNQSATDACARILSICRKCTYLDMNQCITNRSSTISLHDRFSNICYSSCLHTLLINVKNFEDCLCLVDGRLNQLSSLTVKITFIKRSAVIDNNQKILSNLKEFSLICYCFTTAYNCRILPLLHRMTHLNKLTLCLYVIRLTNIDGIDLNEKVLCHMSDLSTFIFHICTIMTTSQTNHFLSTNDIQNTFNNWKYSPVSCNIDHFPDGYTYCHIYSIPFKMSWLMYVTNTFRDHCFQFVIDLVLYDTRPFEHEFFEWVSQAFPLLKYLTLNNMMAQEKKCQIQSVKDKMLISSRILYIHLIRLRLTRAHIDYANQFLYHTNAYVPRLHTLRIQYEKLDTVTNNFTNNATRLNCSQLKRLIFKQLLVCPEHFHLYFPSLTK